ncbi:MAG TPA: hypothetical protein EYG92_06065 [Lutibacter sp.]|nr:hypothetical protein [Lutibacter sp.]
MQKNKFDIHQTPEGHLERFKDRFEANSFNSKSKTHKLKWYLIAASLTLLVSLWYNFKPQERLGYELADVSEQMKETQTYFTSVIESEIKKVNLQKSEHTDQMINDALIRVDLLQNEYNNLSIELKNTGFDKRIINAMIFNFQQRIEILQNLLDQIEIIKNSQNETII